MLSKTMKLAILGATGQTGKQAVHQALEGGHQVTAIVRNPDKMQMSHDNLKVVTADIFSAEELKEHFAEQDAVISCLGFNPEKPKTTGYLLATQAIVSAMSSTTTTRLVLCHSWYTEEESRGQAMFLIRWFLIPMIKPVLDNMREAELWLETECDQKINWTVVRPAGLTNGNLSGKEFKVEVDKFDVPVWNGGRIARADVARFMLSCVSEEKYFKKGLAIAV